jgi:hypothetical protein
LSKEAGMETAKAGIREFRADLAGYIASSTPVALTRHGQTLDELLTAQDVDIEQVVTDFKSARQKSAQAKPSKTSSA